MTDEEIEEMLGEESDMDNIEVNQLAEALIAELRAEVLGDAAKELEDLREQLAVAEKDKAALIQQTIDLRNELEEWRVWAKEMDEGTKKIRALLVERLGIRV